MVVSTRFQTRQAAVCAELPRDTNTKAAPGTKTTSGTATKQTRKHVETQLDHDVASNEVACMSYAEAWVSTSMS